MIRLTNRTVHTYGESEWLNTIKEDKVYISASVGYRCIILKFYTDVHVENDVLTSGEVYTCKFSTGSYINNHRLEDMIVLCAKKVRDREVIVSDQIYDNLSLNVSNIKKFVIDGFNTEFYAVKSTSCRIVVYSVAKKVGGGLFEATMYEFGDTVEIPMEVRYTSESEYTYWRECYNYTTRREDWEHIFLSDGSVLMNKVIRENVKNGYKYVIFKYNPNQLFMRDANYWHEIDGYGYLEIDCGKIKDPDTEEAIYKSIDWLNDNNYVKCVNCGYYVLCGNENYVEGDVFCEDCYQTLMDRGEIGVCDSCGDVFYESHLHYRGGERILCHNCRITSRINGYYYKPNPKFYDTIERYDTVENCNNLYTGVEWEMEQEDSDDKISEEFVSEVHEQLGNYFYCKHDGSLDDSGVEVVSYPMSREVAMYAFGKLTDIMYEYNMSGSANCGVHVHVNRGYFEDSKIACGEMLYLMNRFNDWTDKIAERDYSEWAAIVDVNRVIDLDEDNVPKYEKYFRSIYDEYSGRYHCINKENSNTLEFRIFHSGSKLYEVMQSIDAVRNICDFVATHTMEEVFNVSNSGEFDPNNCSFNPSWSPKFKECLRVGNHVHILWGKGAGKTGTIIKFAEVDVCYGDIIIELDEEYAGEGRTYRDGAADPITTNGIKNYTYNVELIKEPKND